MHYSDYLTLNPPTTFSIICFKTNGYKTAMISLNYTAAENTGMDLKRKVSTFQRYISQSSMGREEMIHITSYQESTPNTPFPACIAWSEWQEQPPLLCHPQTTDKGIRLLLPTAGGRVLCCKPSASTASVYHSIMLEWDLMADKHLYSTHPMIKYVEMQTS